MLVSTLTGVGALFGPLPHLLVGNSRHPATLFSCIVGGTSSGKKGTSMAVARALIERIDPGLVFEHGAGSGEAFIKMLANRGDDPRVVVVEEELARVLKVAGRDGNTLGDQIKTAWDGRTLQSSSLTRGETIARGGKYHLGFVGHITPEELKATLKPNDVHNGTANRFIWICSERSKLLPHGGNVPDHLLETCAAQIAMVLNANRAIDRVEFSPDAKRVWEVMYEKMADDDALNSRSAPYVCRVSLIYALADGMDRIEVPHLNAAWAVVCYSRSSTRWIFGGSNLEEQLLQAIEAAGKQGLTLTAQSRQFSNHTAGLAEARAQLEEAGRIVTVSQSTGGRPVQTSFAAKFAPTQAMLDRLRMNHIPASRDEP